MASARTRLRFLRTTLEAFRLASASSRADKLRSGLTLVDVVVGGIVVMDIMPVSVTERTKEIGVRNAVGARRRDVLTQFLIEAVVLAAAGGAAGVFFGFGLAFALAKLMGFPLLLSAWSAVLGVTVSSAAGILSGLWPARAAARLDPVEALGYE